MALITVHQLAVLLQVRPHRVYELVRQDAIPHVRIGKKQIRFSIERINRWIEEGGQGQDGNASDKGGTR